LKRNFLSFIRYGLVLAALVVIVIPGLSSATSAGEISATRLRCEYRVDPLGIDETRPRLSWVVESSRRAQKQSAYRILAASNKTDLDRDVGDLWDTGKVESDETVHIVYKGKPLKSRMQCFWKVKVWDGQGRPSAWSEPATWSMGLVEPGDWQAKWIGHDTPWFEMNKTYIHLPAPAHWYLNMAPPLPYGVRSLNVGGSTKIYLPCPYLRKDFKAKGKIKSAVVHSTALGVYELRINGERVGDDYFTPGWTDYNRRVYYNTYDVTGATTRSARSSPMAGMRVISTCTASGNTAISSGSGRRCTSSTRTGPAK
jgi:alpha-L-rhamnosidase